MNDFESDYISDDGTFTTPKVQIEKKRRKPEPKKESKNIHTEYLSGSESTNEEESIQLGLNRPTKNTIRAKIIYD